MIPFLFYIGLIKIIYYIESMKTYILFALVVILGLFSINSYITNTKLKKTNSQLISEIISKDTLLTLEKNTTAKLANQLDLQKMEFEQKEKDVVNKLTKKYHQELATYTKLVAKYKIKLDSIQTELDTLSLITDTGDTLNFQIRRFSTSAGTNSELKLSGYFQIQEPYSLSIDSLSLDIKPTIYLSRTKGSNQWLTTIDTHSDFLTITENQVIVDDDFKVKNKNWFFITGGSLTQNKEIGFLQGIGYKNWALYGNIDSKTSQIGILKIW